MASRFRAGIDPSPAARAGRGCKARLGHGRRQTTSSDAARRHAADPEPADACRHSPDSAHQRRHAADRRRARRARTFRADRSRDPRLRDLDRDDDGKNRRTDFDRRRQHREIFRAVHDFRIFETASERRRRRCRSATGRRSASALRGYDLDFAIMGRPPADIDMDVHLIGDHPHVIIAPTEPSPGAKIPDCTEPTSPMRRS